MLLDTKVLDIYEQSSLLPLNHKSWMVLVGNREFWYFYLFLIWLTPLELNVVGASWEVDLKCQYCTPLSSCHLELSDFSLGILYMHLPPSFFFLRDGSIIPMKNQLNLVQIRENMVMFNAVGEQIFLFNQNWTDITWK